jgi:hypothetical protein
VRPVHLSGALKRCAQVGELALFAIRDTISTTRGYKFNRMFDFLPARSPLGIWLSPGYGVNLS